MVHMYWLHMDYEMHEEEMLDLLEFVSLEKRAKVKKYRFIKDAQRTLLGDVLARYLICHKTGVVNTGLCFENNAYGKPQLITPPFVHFNISHSGEWVVAAVSSYPVGIDVEEIKEAPLVISNRFFSKDERLTLFKESKHCQNEAFYYLWTLKESYIKAEGKGLFMKLDTFTVGLGVTHINGMELLNERLDERHVLGLCSAQGQVKHIEKSGLRMFIEKAKKNLG